MVIATERRSFSVLDPADGSVIGSVEDWASRPPRERAEILGRGFSRRDDLARLIVREMGKPLAEGWTVVLKPAEETPLTALADVPEGVINVVTTADPAPVSEAVHSDPRVRKYFAFD